MKRIGLALTVCAMIIAALLWTHNAAYCSEGNRMDGHWKLVPARSSSIDPWSDLFLDIRVEGSSVTIVKRYSAGHPHDVRVDSMTVSVQGGEEIVPVPPGRWLGEVSLGIYYGPHTQRRVRARMIDSRDELQVDSHETVQTAQGSAEVDSQETFVISPDGSTMQWQVTRSTRTSGPPLNFTFARVTK